MTEANGSSPSSAHQSRRCPMQLDHCSTKVLVVGLSGTGKTTFWTKFVRNYRAQTKFIFDHEGEFALRNRCHAATTAESLDAAVHSGWVVFDPGKMFPGATPEAFSFFADYAFAVSQRIKGIKLFACDELQKLAGTNTVTPPIASVLETGRRYGLDFAGICQAPNLVHGRIRNQMTEVVAFRTIDRNALAFLSDAGFDPEAVSKLPNHHYIARNTQTGGQTSGKQSPPGKK